MNEQLALCPLDGRYSNIGIKLSPYFSEYAFVKKRVEIEIFWLKFLIDNKIIKEYDFDDRIKEIYEKFSDEDYFEIKEIEKNIKHDVKTIELFIVSKLKKLNLENLVRYVHIGCTSEDIDNIAYAKLIYRGIHDVWVKNAQSLIYELKRLSTVYSKIPMLGNTHGQAATPTTVGKEFAVYVIRLQNVLEKIKNNKMSAKFNGSVGNYSAINFAFPGENWIELSRKFIQDLGLEFNSITTQIEGYDSIIYLLDYIRHFNNILLDLNIDMWLYISKNYFTQKANYSEVSSSIMPHKINPINFENSESNIDMSNAILISLSNKLAHSRMQRDLSNKSLMRNIGMGFGYSLQSIEQTIEGLSKIEVNTEKLQEDLNSHWEVLAEPLQTILRKYGYDDAYEMLKKLTRGNNITKNDIHNFINTLSILSEEDKKMLLELTPFDYIGLSSKLVDENIDLDENKL